MSASMSVSTSTGSTGDSRNVECKRGNHHNDTSHKRNRNVANSHTSNSNVNEDEEEAVQAEIEIEKRPVKKAKATTGAVACAVTSQQLDDNSSSSGSSISSSTHTGMSGEEHHRQQRSAFTSTLVEELIMLRRLVTVSSGERENVIQHESENGPNPKPHSYSESDPSSDSVSEVMKRMHKIVAMIEEDSVRPVKQSLIDLNQTEHDDDNIIADVSEGGKKKTAAGVDVLMRLIAIYNDVTSQLDMYRASAAINGHGREDGRGNGNHNDDKDSSSARSRAQTHSKQIASDHVLRTIIDQFDTVVWPRVMQLLDNRGPDTKYDASRKDGIDRMTALSFIYAEPNNVRVQPTKSCMYQLAERLLRLRVDPDDFRLCLRTDSVCPMPTLVDAIILLLKHGTDPSPTYHNPDTLMHVLVKEQRLDVLQQLYEQAPSYMIDVDYYLHRSFWSGSIIDRAKSKVKDAQTDEAKQRAEAIVTLLEREQSKLIEIGQIYFEYEPTDTAADTQVHSSNNSSSSSSVSATTTTAPHNSIDHDTMMDEDEDEGEERKQDHAVSLSGNSHAMSHSAAAHSRQHSQHPHGKEEYEFERRVFTRRLLRNIGKLSWIPQGDMGKSGQYVGCVALMFMEDSQRPVEQSLIDLDQVDRDGRTAVHLFCRNYVQSLRHERRVFAISIVHTIIWPRLVQLIRHQQCDIKRMDDAGWSALTRLVCRKDFDDAPRPKYELVESLLQLGANPNQRSGRLIGDGDDDDDGIHTDDEGNPPLVRLAHYGMDEMEGIELLLRYGADIHATNGQGATLLHRLISSGHLTALDYLYTHHPALMFTVDYTHTYPADHMQPVVGSIMSLADSMTRQVWWSASSNIHSTAIFNRVEEERIKQRQQIQQQLLHAAPLIPELGDIVTEYITPMDWKASRHPVTCRDTSADDACK